MASLPNRLSDIIAQAFQSSGLPQDSVNVSISDRPDLSHFQYKAAKECLLKNNGDADIEIINFIQKNKIIKDAYIDEYGVINLTVKRRYLEEYLNEDDSNVKTTNDKEEEKNPLFTFFKVLFFLISTFIIFICWMRYVFFSWNFSVSLLFLSISVVCSIIYLYIARKNNLNKGAFHKTIIFTLTSFIVASIFSILMFLSILAVA